MKTITLIAFAVGLTLTASSAESPEPTSPLRLAGIVSVTDRPCAVLELPGLRHGSARSWTLSEGQRDEGIEVTKISADKGNVDLIWQGTNKITVCLSNLTNIPVPGIVLEATDIGVVLQFFAQFTNRTLLRWPALPATPFNLRAAVNDQAGAAQLLAQALTADNLSIIPDGAKFLMIVPKSKATVVKPHAPSAKASAGGATNAQPTTIGSGAGGTETLPLGMLDFRSADVRQVEDIYAMMVGRKLDRPGPSFYGPNISLQTRNSITLEEGIYALDTLLRWSGIKMVPVGADKLKAVPVQDD